MFFRGFDLALAGNMWETYPDLGVRCMVASWQRPPTRLQGSEHDARLFEWPQEIPGLFLFQAMLRMSVHGNVFALRVALLFQRHIPPIVKRTAIVVIGPYLSPRGRRRTNEHTIQRS